jgi:hypothetical protein
MATAEVHMDDADKAKAPPAASGSIEDEVFEGGAALDPGGDTASAEAPADEVRTARLLTLDSDRLGKDEARLIATARALERCART